MLSPTCCPCLPAVAIFAHCGPWGRTGLGQFQVMRLRAPCKRRSCTVDHKPSGPAGGSDKRSVANMPPSARSQYRGNKWSGPGHARCTPTRPSCWPRIGELGVRPEPGDSAQRGRWQQAVRDRHGTVPLGACRRCVTRRMKPGGATCRCCRLSSGSRPARIWPDGGSPCPYLRTTWREDAWKQLRTAFEEGLGGIPADLQVEPRMEDGDTAPVLVGIASRPGDLLVIGTGRRAGLGRLLRCPVGRYCLVHARCPVLAVPPPTLMAPPGAGRTGCTAHCQTARTPPGP